MLDLNSRRKVWVSSAVRRWIFPANIFCVILNDYLKSLKAIS